MRLHRFFVKESLKDKKKITISEKELLHQWKNVFRLKPGNEVILLDNSSFEFFAVITSLTKNEAELEIINVEKNSNIPIIKLHLFPALIRKERFEWILEKGTEIGVSSFTPVISDRSQNKNFNFERGLKIIKEAGEQSGRGILPKLNKVETVDEALSKMLPKAFALDPGGAKLNLNEFKIPEELNVLVGPEGGWSEKELNLFKEKNIPIYALGEQILRAETASVTISSIILMGK